MGSVVTLITGRSKHGKSFVAKLLAEGFAQSDDPRRRLVYDKLLADWGDVEFLTDDWDEFEATFWEEHHLAVFCDEFGEDKSKKTAWTATRGMHHNDHTIFYLVHRYKDLDPTLRDQASEVYAFATSKRNADELADDFGADELRNLPKLPVGVFYHAGAGIKCQKYKIDFAARRIVKADD